MIEMLGIATMTAIPVVIDYMIVKDDGEKLRRGHLKEFYRKINSDRHREFYNSDND